MKKSGMSQKENSARKNHLWNAYFHLKIIAHLHHLVKPSLKETPKWKKNLLQKMHIFQGFQQKPTQPWLEGEKSEDTPTVSLLQIAKISPMDGSCLCAEIPQRYLKPRQQSQTPCQLTCKGLNGWRQVGQRVYTSPPQKEQCFTKNHLGFVWKHWNMSGNDSQIIIKLPFSMDESSEK